MRDVSADRRLAEAEPDRREGVERQCPGLQESSTRPPGLLPQGASRRGRCRSECCRRSVLVPPRGAGTATGRRRPSSALLTPPEHLVVRPVVRQRARHPPPAGRRHSTAASWANRLCWGFHRRSGVQYQKVASGPGTALPRQGAYQPWLPYGSAEDRSSCARSQRVGADHLGEVLMAAARRRHRRP